MLPICWRSRRWLGGKNTWCFTPWSGDFWANPSHGCNSWCAQRVWGMIPEEARLGTTSLGMFSWLQLPWAAGTLTVPRSGSGLTTSLEWTGQITCSDIKYHGWNLKSKTPIPNEKLDGFWGIGNIVLFSKLFFDVWKSWASSSNLKRIIYRRNSSGFFLIIKLLVRKFPQNGEVTPPPVVGRFNRPLGPVDSRIEPGRKKVLLVQRRWKSMLSFCRPSWSWTSQIWRFRCGCCAIQRMSPWKRDQL